MVFFASGIGQLLLEEVGFDLEFVGQTLGHLLRALRDIDDGAEFGGRLAELEYLALLDADGGGRLLAARPAGWFHGFRLLIGDDARRSPMVGDYSFPTGRFFA
jgi:hypothetical protein